MSICFYHKGTLYADQFQILDYVDFVSVIVENKIFVNESKDIIIAIMGIVPDDINDVMKRIERMFFVMKEQVADDENVDKIVSTITESLASLKMTFMLILKNNKKYRVFKSMPEPVKCGWKVTLHKLGETVTLYCPRIVKELLDKGMAPKKIFAGASLYTNTVSSTYTAYSVKHNKFLKT